MTTTTTTTNHQRREEAELAAAHGGPAVQVRDGVWRFPDGCTLHRGPYGRYVGAPPPDAVRRPPRVPRDAAAAGVHRPPLAVRRTERRAGFFPVAAGARRRLRPAAGRLVGRPGGGRGRGRETAGRHRRARRRSAVAEPAPLLARPNPTSSSPRGWGVSAPAGAAEPAGLAGLAGFFRRVPARPPAPGPTPTPTHERRRCA